MILQLCALAGVLLLLATQRGALLDLVGPPGPVELDNPGDLVGEPTAEQGQGGAALEVSAFLGSVDMGAAFDQVEADQAQINVGAFLAMIRRAEGTADQAGYNRIFGGATFQDMSDHPRQAVQFTDQAGRRLYSTAAGAYQFMAISPTPAGQTKVDTWDRMQRRLSLPDFSPQSQDTAALQLIDDAGALGDVRAGRLDAAVGKVRRIWASLPGAGYAQPEKSMPYLRDVYAAAGGVFA